MSARLLPAVLVVALFFAACRTKTEAIATSTDAAASRDAASAVDGRKLAVDNCMMCHGEDLLRQQRLTSTQWASVVKKMSSWGAPIEPENTAALVAYLAATYGPDAGPFVPSVIPAASAAAELAAQEDGPFAGGDAVRGGSLFAATCAACHGPSARGQIGVSLVDRPILQRADEVATRVRTGRGRMPPMPMTDAQIADLLAYLRQGPK